MWDTTNIVMDPETINTQCSTCRRKRHTLTSCDGVNLAVTNRD